MGSSKGQAREHLPIGRGELNASQAELPLGKVVWRQCQMIQEEAGLVVCKQ